MSSTSFTTTTIIFSPTPSSSSSSSMLLLRLMLPLLLWNMVFYKLVCLKKKEEKEKKESTLSFMTDEYYLAEEVRLLQLRATALISSIDLCICWLFIIYTRVGSAKVVVTCTFLYNSYCPLYCRSSFRTETHFHTKNRRQQHLWGSKADKTKKWKLNDAVDKNVCVVAAW